MKIVIGTNLELDRVIVQCKSGLESFIENHVDSVCKLMRGSELAQNFFYKLPNLNVAVNVEYYYKYSCDGSDHGRAMLEFISKGLERLRIDIGNHGI